MEIDKTRRQIISVEINDVMLSVRQGFLGDRSNFSFFHDNLKPVANSISKKQTRVREDHLVVNLILPAPWGRRER